MAATTNSKQSKHTQVVTWPTEAAVWTRRLAQIESMNNCSGSEFHSCCQRNDSNMLRETLRDELLLQNPRRFSLSTRCWSCCRDTRASATSNTDADQAQEPTTPNWENHLCAHSLWAISEVYDLLTLSRMLRTSVHTSSLEWCFRSSALSRFPLADSTSFKVLSCHSKRSSCFSR